MLSQVISSYEDDGYRLGRSFAASSRLNLQHYLWKDVLGYNIHPDIPLRDSEDFRIADIGTGTGIWLIDLNRQLKSAQLNGFDVSADQFPPEEWLPANISLRTLNVLRPISPELIGKYDLINVRLFLAVVRDNDPAPMLRNLVEMLKPGGYIQWSELNVESATVDSVKPCLTKHNVQFILDHSRSIVPPHDWPPQLANFFADQGLQGVSYHRYQTSPEVRTFFTHMQLMLYEEMTSVTMDSSGSDKEGPMHRKRLQEAAKDVAEGVAYRLPIQITYGKKAVLDA